MIVLFSEELCQKEILSEFLVFVQGQVMKTGGSTKVASAKTAVSEVCERKKFDIVIFSCNTNKSFIIFSLPDVRTL